MTEIAPPAHTPGHGGKLAFLSKRVLGVPVVYFMLAGVIVLAFVAWRAERTTPKTADGSDNGDATDAQPSSTDSTDLDATSTDFQAGASQPTVNAVTADTTNASPSTQLVTNDQWVQQGSTWLVSHNMATAASANGALVAYVAGDSLSYAQNALATAVAKQYGQPPEAFAAGGVGAAPVAAAKKQGEPPCVHTVKNSSDNTLQKLIRLYYGFFTGAQNTEMMENIQAANYGTVPVENGNAQLPVGTKIKIPKYVKAGYFTATKTVDTAAEIGAKNGVGGYAIGYLNPGMKFPVKAGTRVRVR